MAGGKSRKSGGVSQKLIAQIKSGNPGGKSSCGTKKPSDDPRNKSLLK